jgi:hypothetical protein
VSISAIAESSFKKASSLFPTKIQQVFAEPKVQEVILAIGRPAVLNQIEYELECLADLMSVGGNLNVSQVPFIAEQLVEMFPTESIADFKICFRSGAMGKYGDIQRMDGITIGKWMEKYLDEKYQVMEDELMKEKDDLYKPVVLTEKEKSNIDVDKMLEAYKQSLSVAQTKSIRPMTEEEIKAEGDADADPYKVWRDRYLKNKQP